MLISASENQVTPFYIKTPDDEALFCWHILPLELYAKHQDDLSIAPEGTVENFVKSKAFSLLSGDSESRVVINFHGNAGHVAQGWRPATYKALSGLSNTHTITCDYRGFGRSTGSPTEAGVITDSVAIIDYVLNTLSQPASRVVLLGQSLGTAVSSAATLYYLDPESAYLPDGVTKPKTASNIKTPTIFAGTILVAPFTNLPDLLLTYRIAGIIPVLSPLRHYPRILKFLTDQIVDTWDTLSRLQEAVRFSKTSKKPFNLQILHARNDPDIEFSESDKLFDGIEEAMQESGVEQSSIYERKTKKDGKVRRGAWAYKKTEDEFTDLRVKRKVEMEITRFGGEYLLLLLMRLRITYADDHYSAGHNEIVSNTAVAMAVLRAFNGAAKLEALSGRE